MSAARISARITEALHQAAIVLYDTLHGLHATALNNHFNDVAKRSALKRKELQDIGVETRARMLDAKVDYQRALAAAQAAFGATKKAIEKDHDTARDAVIAALKSFEDELTIVRKKATEHAEA